MYKVILLDFDGVLVESNEVKDRAFEILFAAYPQELPAIMAYHHSTASIRFEKFRYIYEHILGKTYTSDIEQDLCRRFSEYCIRGVIDCPWVKGAPEFLAFFTEKLPMYLITINPPDDLNQVLLARGIKSLFKGIYPVAGNKADAIKDILKREQCVPVQAVFVGDSRGDLTSAQEAKVSFIGRNSQYDFSADKVPVFNDMSAILNFIGKNV